MMQAEDSALVFRIRSLIPELSRSEAAVAEEADPPEGRESLRLSCTNTAFPVPE